MKKKSIPLKLRSQIAIRDNGICQICGKIGTLKPTYFGYMAFEKASAYSKDQDKAFMRGYISFEIDHIRQEWLGGGLSAENLRLVCRPCNKRRKRNG